jgi:hypothetical protein
VAEVFNIELRLGASVAPTGAFGLLFGIFPLADARGYGLPPLRG